VAKNNVFVFAARSKTAKKRIKIATFIQFSYARGASKKLCEARTMYLASLRGQTAKKYTNSDSYLFFVKFSPAALQKALRG